VNIFLLLPFLVNKRCIYIAREGVQSTHHGSGRIETVTETGLGKARSCRHCGSHSSVASI